VPHDSVPAMWTWLGRLSPRIVLFATWLIGLTYAFPGYMNHDAADQLIQLRHGDITDFHPPIIIVYWRLLDAIWAGPFGMLLLQSLLFLWGVHALLRLRFAERPAAWITAAIVLFPPVLTPMAVIWKDAQMAAFLVAGTSLALRPARRARIVGTALLVLAAGVRYNGGAALPTLVFLAVSAWTSRRFAVRLAIVAALLAATFVATSRTNYALADRHVHAWYRTAAMFDVIGTICHAPPLDDAEIATLLDGVTLREHEHLQARFCQVFPPGDRNWFAYAELYTWVPDKDERAARLRAWWRVVSRFPGAYAWARLRLAADHLGLLTDKVPLWEPVGQDFAPTEAQRQTLQLEITPSSLQRALGDSFRWLAQHTPLYHAWIYVLLAIALVVWAVRRRDALIGCLVGSGLLYQSSIFLLTCAVDFRFAHWLITCTCLGTALAIGAARARRAAGSRSAREPDAANDAAAPLGPRSEAVLHTASELVTFRASPRLRCFGAPGRSPTLRLRSVRPSQQYRRKGDRADQARALALAYFCVVGS